MRVTTSSFASTVLVGLAVLGGTVWGNTPLTDEFVRRDMKENGGLEIAYASRP